MAHQRIDMVLSAITRLEKANAQTREELRELLGSQWAEERRKERLEREQFADPADAQTEKPESSDHASVRQPESVVPQLPERRRVLAPLTRLRSGSKRSVAPLECDPAAAPAAAGAPAPAAAAASADAAAAAASSDAAAAAASTDAAPAAAAPPTPAPRTPRTPAAAPATPPLPPISPAARPARGPSARASMHIAYDEQWNPVQPCTAKPASAPRAGSPTTAAG